MNLETLPLSLGNNRTPRRAPVDLIVVHTNEGPEGPSTAEGLAAFLHNAPDNYNVIVDENSAIRTAFDNECVWGAGGVNSRAWHICITGRAAFSPAVWADPSEASAVGIVADLVHQACMKLGVPLTRVTDTRPGAPRGVCGHVDVSRYHPESMGHTDPGPSFPWPRLFTNGPIADGDTMTQDQVALMFAVLNDIKDRVGWVESAVMPGGHADRTPATAEQMRADITAIKKKTGA